MNDSAPFLLTIVVTYLLHSSILLGLAWLLFRFGRLESHVLAERVWKAAAIGSLLTVPLQLQLGSGAAITVPAAAMGNLRPAGGTAGPHSEPHTQAMVEDAAGMAPVPRTPNSPPGLFGGIVGRTVETPITSTDQPVRSDGSGDEPTSAGADVQATPVSIPRISAVVLGNGEAAGRAVPSSVSVIDIGSAEPVDPETERIGSAFASAGRVERNEQSATERPPQPMSNERQAVRATATLVVGHIPRTVLLLIAIVTAIGLILAIRQSTALWCLLRRCQRCDDESLAGMAGSILASANCPREVTIWKSSEHTEPMAFGVFRWHIVVPARTETSLTLEETRALLAHELAHLVRGDGAWLFVWRLLCTCFACQPLNFVARRRWQHAAEIACDQWAVEQTSTPLALARCLTTIADWKIRTHSVTAATLGAARDAANLSRRVERLLDDRDVRDAWSSRSRRLQLLLAFTVIASGITLQGPRLRLAAASPAETPAQSIDTAASRGRMSSELEQLARETRQLESELSELISLVEDAQPTRDIERLLGTLESQRRRLEDRRHTLARLQDSPPAAELTVSRGRTRHRDTLRGGRP